MPLTTLPYAQEMNMIHRVFRREAAQLRAAVAATPGGDAVRAGVVAGVIREYVGGLEHHHATEDAMIWPLLHARAGAREDLVERMEEQHHVLDATLAVVLAHAGRWAHGARAEDREALVEAFDEHVAVLAEHLDDEEKLVMPIVEEHLTPDEWEAVGRRGLENVPRSQVFIALGAILEDATPQERAYFLAKVPAPGRLLWHLIGRRQYRRWTRRLRGA
ncbi:hypothetical protein Val02_36550 [Virgisporangium aliadipatigenens]|uniref:Hemerythrin-like domain-containing protein n=1 Tax=Virgisporangium aliadipatigenens TaxID=741659 RepID=A0A8J3YJW4_9ACTN|nr:hemerythrin domain-containing protein [Virgisporangium aliadipatigenens]GIJ46769.1 hypothetical protein Val02_36550 [Virgisporangium aliadipatigenens]